MAFKIIHENNYTYSQLCKKVPTHKTRKLCKCSSISSNNCAIFSICKKCNEYNCNCNCYRSVFDTDFEKYYSYNTKRPRCSCNYYDRFKCDPDDICSSCNFYNCECRCDPINKPKEPRYVKCRCGSCYPCYDCGLSECICDCVCSYCEQDHKHCNCSIDSICYDCGKTPYKIITQDKYSFCKCKERKIIDYDRHTGNVYINYKYIPYMYYSNENRLVLNFEP